MLLNEFLEFYQIKVVKDVKENEFNHVVEYNSKFEIHITPNISSEEYPLKIMDLFNHLLSNVKEECEPGTIIYPECYRDDDTYKEKYRKNLEKHIDELKRVVEIASSKEELNKIIEEIKSYDKDYVAPVNILNTMENKKNL